MITLSEKDITSQFTGLPINAETLKHCAHKNSQGTDPAVYIVYSCGFLYNPELRELFGITDKLKELWERRGIEFNISIHITDNRIVRCEIDKYTESGGARASCNYLKCTQQELRVTRRILSYVTQS